MIAFSSGSAWNSASEEQRNQLVDAFARMSIATYASQFNGYTNEAFEVLGERGGPRGSILVDTRIVRDPKPPVAITYVMDKTGDQWRVIDILLEKKVSEMARRRSEYRQIIQQGGSNALIRALNEKTDKLLSQPAQ
jgi:phospholipid transport system substrate-binding protein